MPNQTGPKTSDPPSMKLKQNCETKSNPTDRWKSTAFHRLITAAWQLEQCPEQEGNLVCQEPNDQNEANLESCTATTFAGKAPPTPPPPNRAAGRNASAITTGPNSSPR